MKINETTKINSGYTSRQIGTRQFQVAENSQSAYTYNSALTSKTYLPLQSQIHVICGHLTSIHVKYIQHCGSGILLETKIN